MVLSSKGERVEHPGPVSIVSSVESGDMMELDGRFQIYTGNGKGKTTSALGLAVRAACAGYRVYIGQFMKGGGSSETALPGHFPGTIAMEQFGTPGLIGRGEKPAPEDRELASKGLKRVEESMLSGSYDIVIADEICTALHMALLESDDVVGLAGRRPGNVELVFTGRYAPDVLTGIADLVTEMKQVKHYFDTEGLGARRGIEF
jgi:cob(I)alamin adenosyltransferase